MQEQLHHQRRNQSCSTECSHRKERPRLAHFSFKQKEGNAENKVCWREAAGRVSRKQRSPKTTAKRGSLEKLRRNPPSPVPASLTCLSTPSQHKRVGSCGQRHPDTAAAGTWDQAEGQEGAGQHQCRLEGPQGAAGGTGPRHRHVLVPVVWLQQVAEQTRVGSSWSPSPLNAPRSSSAPRGGPGAGQSSAEGPPRPLAQLVTRACAKHLGVRPLD